MICICKLSYKLASTTLFFNNRVNALLFGLRSLKISVSCNSVRGRYELPKHMVRTQVDMWDAGVPTIMLSGG